MFAVEACAAREGRMDSGRLHRLREPRFELRRFARGSARGIVDDVRGLAASPKTLPPDFHDARGAFRSSRFAAPGVLPDPHRGCVVAHRARFDRTGAPVEIVELGSGDAQDRASAGRLRAPGAVLLPPAGGHLRRYPACGATRLASTLSWLEIEAWAGDYTDGLMRLEQRAGAPVSFLGGTIGNLTKPRLWRFCAGCARIMSERDRFRSASIA